MSVNCLEQCTCQVFIKQMKPRISIRCKGTRGMTLGPFSNVQGGEGNTLFCRQHEALVHQTAAPCTVTRVSRGLPQAAGPSGDIETAGTGGWAWG